MKSVREYLVRKIGITLPAEAVAEVVEQHVHDVEVHLHEVKPPYRRADDIDSTVLEAIDAYLSGIGAFMWGRAFSIDSQEGRDRASAFILNTLRGVSKEMNRGG